jgi:hypothetical protein
MKKLLLIILLLPLLSFGQTSIDSQYIQGKQRVGDSIGYYPTYMNHYIDKITTAGCYWNLWDFVNNVYDTIKLNNVGVTQATLDDTALNLRLYLLPFIDSGIIYETPFHSTNTYEKLGDSLIYYTKYRSDTSRTNIYNNIEGKQPIGNYILYSDTPLVISTKFDVDTAKLRLTSAINTKGVGSVTSISGGTNLLGGTITSSGTLTPDTSSGHLATKIDLISYMHVMAGNAISTTTYTLLSSDLGKTLHFTSGSAITLTIPSSLGSNFFCTIMQEGVGLITPTASSTTLHFYPTSSTKSAGQFSQFTINETSVNDTYYIQGATQ